jgi:uncharacterized repeat protein (TIGR01451 family)
MKRSVPRWGLLLLAGCLCALTGCFGKTHNPSYYPYNLWPFGDIIQTHAKPTGPGYYGNFDPNAVRLELRPLSPPPNPVRTQHVLIATVYDERNQPRRSRRVEWMIEGAGHIIEVDESGFHPGRGYKVTDKHAVSYTNFLEHRITRGNQNPADDFVIRPGQTWCVISSPVEGDTHVTVYAPGVANWERGRAFSTIKWVDANWELPSPAQARAGTEHTFTSKIFRQTDRQPLANYRVRYTVLDGPPAVFRPANTPDFLAVSDLGGNAHATIAQVSPTLGTNRIGIEIIRPPDPTAPSGTAVTIARGETTIEWLAPAIALAHTGPPNVAVNQEMQFTTTINNTGRIESRSMTVTSQIPDGVQFVRAQPPAILEGRQLTWTFGALQAGQAHTIQTLYKALRPGPVTSCAAVVTEEGLKDEKCHTTQVTQPGLKVAITGPQGAAVGAPVTYQITVTNPGTGPAANVSLKAEFDPGLEHETKANPLNLGLGILNAGEARSVPLVLTPTRVGRLNTRVTATAEGGLTDTAEHAIVVQQPQLNVTIEGPKTKYVNRPADFVIKVSNAGDVPLTNVFARVRLPAELAYVGSTPAGQPAAGEVVWNLGPLQPKEQKIVQLSTIAQRPAANAVVQAIANADPSVSQTAQTSLEILGIPALRLEMKDIGDPAETGKKITYEIDVTNTGSLPANQVEIKAVASKHMKIVSGKGPAAEKIDGQSITFARLDGLAPNRSVKYTVEVEAIEAGDARFRIELRSETLQQPVIDEEPTRIYSPLQGPVNPPPQGL